MRRPPARSAAASSSLDQLFSEIRACRVCVDRPVGKPLPHAPRPVVRASATATIAIYGQAPGTRVHASGLPFNDASGVRLRAWMGVTPEEFYDEAQIAIVPMGFCFPGLDAKGGDLPPRRECAPLWRDRVLEQLPQLRVILLVGLYAQRWHLTQALGKPWRENLTDTVRGWRRLVADRDGPVMIPLPHPSWRNTGWIKANPWFEADLLPELRRLIREARGPIQFRQIQ